MYVIKASVCAECFAGRRKLTAAQNLRPMERWLLPVTISFKAIGNALELCSEGLSDGKRFTERS